jgi:glutathione S-transferase
MVPCLVDGETVVWDSLAVTEYLAEKFPGVWPTDSGARAWARCAAAEMHSGFSSLRSTCAMICGLRVRIDPYPPAVLDELSRIDELWQDGLSRFGGPFLAGRAFTAVDAFFAPVAFRIQTYQPQLSAPALEYAARLLSLPAMREWYASALGETWREEQHEIEVRQAGTVLEDFRRPQG